MAKHRTTKILSIDEFNTKLNELDAYEIPYEITTDRWFNVEAKTTCYIYRASLLNKQPMKANPAVISNEFHKITKYHYLDKVAEDEKVPYGYKLVNIKSTSTKKVKWALKTDSGYAWVNKSLAGKWLKCWAYDLNSAFPYAMLQPMPDTTKTPRYYDIIQENEIGFYYNGGATTTIGDCADIIFPLMESPFKKYIDIYYTKKQNATDKLERDIWKLYLNIPTGCIQRHNIFLRNAIIYYSNEYIKSFIDDDTVYCNIDCIVSLKPRTDLPIGNEIGLFKEEHTNDNFKYLNCGIYQWNSECHYKGLPGNVLDDIENIGNWQANLKTTIDYIFNEKTRRIEKWQKK